MSPEVSLKNAHFCITLRSLYKYAKKNEQTCSNGSWDIDCERANLIKVTSKTATPHTG